MGFASQHHGKVNRFGGLSSSSSSQSNRNRAFKVVVNLSVAVVLMTFLVYVPCSTSCGNPAPHCALLFGMERSQAPLMTASAATSDSTGKLFTGDKVRTFTGNWRFQEQTKNKKFKASKNSNKNKNILGSIRKYNCTKWAVVTTIFEPSDGVKAVAEHLTDWCMVVVGDTKTPTDYAKSAGWDDNSKNLVFLSVKDQQKITHPFIDKIPYRSFARKNIGFLFAVLQGARTIFDFDDDNVITSNAATTINTFANDPTVMAQTVTKLPSSYKNPAFNPFPLMKPSITSPKPWPRGFPIEQVQNAETWGDNATIVNSQVDLSTVGVIQSVCDGDPDVDAIYRLTHPLPLTFGNGPDAHHLVVPRDKYVPYNAQATIHYYKAFWGLFLPWTVTGRVTDIWRSYITDRILKDIDMDVMYSTPLVTHHRNEHSYLADFEAETHLYLRTAKLLEFLNEWDSTEQTTLPARLEKLWIELYERNYFEMDDIVGVQEWLAALQHGGYEFPTVSSSAS